MGTERMQAAGSSLPVQKRVGCVHIAGAQSSQYPPNKHISLSGHSARRLLTAQENAQKTVASLQESPTKKRQIFYVFWVFFLRARRSDGTHAIRDTI